MQGLFWIAVAATAIGADPNEPVMKSDLVNYLKTTGAERAKAQAALELKSGERALDLARKGRIDRTRTDTFVVNAPAGSIVWYPSREAKAKYIRERELRELDVAELKAMQTRNLPLLLPVLRASSIRTGCVGLLRTDHEFIDDIPEGRAANVLQIVDAENMLVTIDKRTLWLEFPTKGFVDDRPFDLTEICWEVVGTKMYGADTGASLTVFHLRPLDLAKLNNNP